MVTKYTLYTTTGLENFAKVCEICSASAFEVRRINSDLDIDGQKILDYQTSGAFFPSGTVIKIPYSNTGSVEENSDSYATHEVLEGLGGTSYTSGFQGRHSKLYSYNSESASSRGINYNCTVHVLLNGSVQSVWTLPVIPQEFSDNNSASFSSQSILGRSVDYQIYQGSSRSVSFTLSLHNELCSDYNYISNLVSYIQSAEYPRYSSGVVEVPEICFTIGSQFKVRGILESCSATWKTPVIDGKMVNCDLSVSVKETSGPWSHDDIKSIGGFRG